MSGWIEIVDQNFNTEEFDAYCRTLQWTALFAYSSSSMARGPQHTHPRYEQLPPVEKWPWER